MPAIYDPVLQADLDAIWFRLPDAATRAKLGISDASLSFRQEWFIRAFQICAHEIYGAQDTSDGAKISAAALVQVKLKDEAKLPPGSFPHGVADPPTRAAIQFWKANKLRCPIIFQTRQKQGGKKKGAAWPQIVAEGFFFHDELRDKDSRVFVRDFTRDAAADPLVVGTALPWGKHVSWGIAATAAHTLPKQAASLTPDRLIGKSWDTLSNEAKSTFRVVAAIAAVESGGVFDGLNAFDTSVLSAGPYHFRACPSGDIGLAELGAFLAYYRSISPDASRQFFERFAIGTTDDWGKTMKVTENATYLAEIGFVDADGKFPALDDETERDFLRTWHSFYRVQSAMRMSADLQKAFWPFVRQRIADVRAAPFASPPPGGATLGDVFSDELCLALLIRWHVFLPGRVVRDGKAGPVPVKALSILGLDKKPLAQWTQGDRYDLADVLSVLPSASGLSAQASAALISSLQNLGNWHRPEWSPPTAGKDATLSPASPFAMDMSGLPILKGP
jgi:hypothetical protein